MSHDLYATLASAEIANIIKNDQPFYYTDSGYEDNWTVAAGREGGRLWPLADGVISSYNPVASKEIQVAVEFKRVNEGLHGTLTALGQSLAYLHKGYHASIIIVPEKYISHDTPAQHIKEILDLTANNMPIGIFSYEEPDLTKLRPFENKIICHRKPKLSLEPLPKVNNTSTKPRSSTLWAHVREGMSFPDVFYKYCNMVKYVTSNNINKSYHIPTEILDAIQRVSSDADPYKYLSNTTNNSILDRAWFHTWFEFYFHQSLIPIFSKNYSSGNLVYEVNTTPTLCLKDEEDYAKLLTGRKDSIKEKLVAELNNQEITEDEAWELYVKKVRDTAHSYREVIDSGLYHLNLIDNNGNLTTVGYRFVDEANKGGSVYSSTSMQILRGAALTYGNFSAFLHYIYRLSEDVFEANPLAFCQQQNNGVVFNQNEYKEYIYDKMKNELSLILTSSSRSTTNPRHPFQAELPFLKHLGIVIDKRSPFRAGIGLLINWPVVQESIDFMRNNNL